MKKIIWLCISLCLLTGCMSPVKVTPPNTYVINKIPAVPYKKSRAITLLVLMPQTSSIYNTTAMAYTTQPYQIAYFAKNVWADTPAKMLQPLLVQSLQNTHYFRAVITVPVGGYNYVLATQIQQLLQDFSVQPHVLRLRVRAQLIRVSSNRLMAEKQFSLIETLPTSNPYGGVIAANQATADLLSQITQFCLQNIR